MTDEIKAGDAVRLKTGGPEMTVSFVYKERLVKRVVCNWFIWKPDGWDYGHGVFGVPALEKVEKKGD